MIEAFSNIFSNDQVSQAKQLFDSLSEQQRLWLSGYLAGYNQSGAFLNEINKESSPKEVLADESSVLTVVYGTHTGNSKLIGEKFLALAKVNGMKVQLCSMAEYRSRKLKEEKNLLVIVSTHGEGEPPVSAEDFYAYVFGKKAPQLSDLNFAVIGLGDSSYIHFCQTGNDIYNQLKVLGAHAIHDIFELDVDFKDHLDSTLSAIVASFANLHSTVHKSIVSNKSVGNGSAGQEWTEVEVLEKILLNNDGASKETYHIELDIEDTAITYQPGDALEVKSLNSEKLVLAILNKLHIAENEEVDVDGSLLSIKEALINRYEITVVTLPVLKKYIAASPNKDLEVLIDDTERLKQYLYGADFLDVLNDYPIQQLNKDELVGILRKLPPRLYSISSSYDFNPDEVHITVSNVHYDLNDRAHSGVCSSFLSSQINIGDRVWVRIKTNEGFRLPHKDAKVIMVGPGTGIAPFRSFLQQREAEEASGANWLFFGNQHLTSDFLYQTEILHHRKKGLLSNLDVAFSRDQEEKIYVQQRLKEKGESVYKWLKEGAYFYLCGDKNKMAKDVKNELLQIIKIYGQKSTEEADVFLKDLQKENRFQEDVY